MMKIVYLCTLCVCLVLAGCWWSELLQLSRTADDSHSLLQSCVQLSRTGNDTRPLAASAVSPGHGLLQTVGEYWQILNWVCVLSLMNFWFRFHFHSFVCTLHLQYTGWQWCNFIPYLGQLAFDAILRVKLSQIFRTVIPFKYALLVS